MNTPQWQVTSNIIGGKRKYAVYRLIDPAQSDHSGNREFAGGYIDSETTAQAGADYFNAQKTPPSEL